MIDIGWTAEDFEAELIAEAADRRSLRRLAQTPCQVVAEEGFRLLGEQTLDLSPDGMLLRSDAIARLGELVYVSLRVPFGRSWIDAEGEIVRVVRGLRRTDPARGLGVRFTRISAFDRALLHGALERLPTLEAARRPRRDYAATVAHIMFPVLARLSSPPS